MSFSEFRSIFNIIELSWTTGMFSHQHRFVPLKYSCDCWRSSNLTKLSQLLLAPASLSRITTFYVNLISKMSLRETCCLQMRSTRRDLLQSKQYYLRFPARLSGRWNSLDIHLLSLTFHVTDNISHVLHPSIPPISHAYVQPRSFVHTAHDFPQILGYFH